MNLENEVHDYESLYFQMRQMIVKFEDALAEANAEISRQEKAYKVFSEGFDLAKSSLQAENAVLRRKLEACKVFIEKNSPLSFDETIEFELQELK